ncbi:MAG: hypothetical protein IJQ99_02245 [Synergistaceae bacterium]|nr:hypothetical protein [Synergistaceae bacterium]
MTKLERKLMNMQPNERKKAVEAISGMMGVMSRSSSKVANNQGRKVSEKKK